MSKTRTILITGGDGFVGRNFRKVLTEDDVTNVDIKSGTDCRDFFKESDRRFDLVIHLAAVVGGRSMIENDPLTLAAEDLSIDASMWRWAQKTRPGRIVYYSSSAAYPAALQELPGTILTETDISLKDIHNPDFTYGWVKLTGEMLAEHARAEGLNVSVFRPFSGYGVDQDLTYPWPSLVKRAKEKADPFDVWGDGTQTRDWIHISDVVAATLKAVDEGVDGPVNLCTGMGISFINFAAMAMELAGYKGEIRVNPDMPQGCRFRVGDPTKMNEFYVPKVALEDAVREALQ